MMFKKNNFTAILLFLLVGFVACDEEEEVNIEKQFTPTYAGKTAYVITQGNQSSKISGGIDILNLEEKTVTLSAFYQANGQYLGEIPQSGIRYGSNMYVPMYGSNCVWVINTSTLLKVAQISVNSPEAVCGSQGYIFVASNEGYVVRYSASDYTQQGEQLQVGPNPAGLTAVNGKVYVTISDGYNYSSANPYENGKKVVEIDAENFTITNTFEVGLNPGQIFSTTKGEIYLIARGDYGANPSKVQKIATDGTVSDFCEGALMTMENDTLYVLNTGYNDAWELELKSAKYYALTAGTSGDINFGETVPVSPISIHVSPVSGNIFVCSCASTSYTAYSEPGLVYEYESVKKGNTFVNTYNVGVEPYSIIFY